MDIGALTTRDLLKEVQARGEEGFRVATNHGDNPELFAYMATEAKHLTDFLPDEILDGIRTGFTNDSVEKNELEK